ncbi:hypothetical protein CB1_000573002 [Camelus ferus]|nr:hypothetical protein CB1_000573002 [Camelus ferus]
MRSLLTGGSKSALDACRERGALGSTLVVAGMKYFLEVEIGRTTCTKSQPNLASCPFHNEPHIERGCAGGTTVEPCTALTDGPSLPPQKMLCSFQVHTVPWLGVVSMGKSSCQAE